MWTGQWSNGIKLWILQFLIILAICCFLRAWCILLLKVDLEILKANAAALIILNWPFLKALTANWNPGFFRLAFHGDKGIGGIQSRCRFQNHSVANYILSYRLLGVIYREQGITFLIKLVYILLVWSPFLFRP